MARVLAMLKCILNIQRNNQLTGSKFKNVADA